MVPSMSDRNRDGLISPVVVETAARVRAGERCVARAGRNAAGTSLTCTDRLKVNGTHFRHVRREPEREIER